MLTLARRIGETIRIGDDIVITIVSVKGQKQVHLRIAAPAHVSVHREEIYQQILAEKAKRHASGG